MSAGNAILYSNLLGPVAFPTTTTLLSSGNYWFEEFDFELAFSIYTAAGDGVLQFTMQTSPGATTIWNSYWLAQPTAAGNFRFNIPVTTRPRIFIPRTQSVTLSLAATGAISQAVYTVNIYGRSLP